MEKRGKCALFATAAATTIMFGCPSTPTAPPPILLPHHRADKADDIATIHLSTILVWSWDDVTTAIQPNFTVDVSLAGPAIVATSQANQQFQRNSEVNFDLSVGAPASTATKASSALGRDQSQASNSGSPKDSGKLSNSTKGQSTDSGNGKNGQNNASSDESNAQSNPKSSGSQNSKGSNGATGQPALALSDAMTRLQATNALYQEAGLLNNFSKGLIQRAGYIPYIIRSQLTVLPKYRQEPYDLFVSMKVEPEQPDLHDEPGAPPIVVVPLLVTESIEDAQVADLSQLAQQVQLGLSAGVSIEKITAETRQSINELSSSLSYRPNSLFAIGKSGTNELLVRMGANRFGNDYELEPLAHSISFVALINRRLIKEGSSQLPMKITATPTYRDALIDDPHATKNDVVGGSITDHFVLQFNPYAYRTKDSSGQPLIYDWWCPDATTVVVLNDSPTGATATVRGLLDWGNRQAYGTLYGTLKDKSRVTFNSNLATRNSNGTVLLSFDSISGGVPRANWPKKWNFYLNITRLKTDANYKDDDPVNGCEFVPAVIEVKNATAESAKKTNKPASGGGIGAKAASPSTGSEKVPPKGAPNKEPQGRGPVIRNPPRNGPTS
jgi:hypothetical protein